MKINEIKHNHSLTDLLKVLLFSILMLLPFLDVGTRCAYVIANKNAYQSYSGEVQTEYVNTNIEDLEANKNYLLTNEILSAQGEGTTQQTTLYIENVIDNSNQFDLSSANNIVFYLNSSGLPRAIIRNNSTQITSYALENYIININFDFLSLNSLNNNSWLTNLNLFKTRYNNNSYYMDNVFEYSVSQLEESNLYNWTTQTAIYSGVSQMTTQLGITGNIIPIILCYWFFITIIYIILDIVIKLFTILTHFIGSKTSS